MSDDENSNSPGEEESPEDSSEKKSEEDGKDDYYDNYSYWFPAVAPGLAENWSLNVLTARALAIMTLGKSSHYLADSWLLCNKCIVATS